jgi:hypothetical protein
MWDNISGLILGLLQNFFEKLSVEDISGVPPWDQLFVYVGWKETSVHQLSTLAPFTDDLSSDLRVLFCALARRHECQLIWI